MEVIIVFCLILFGGIVDDIISINLVVEGMIFCKFKKVNIFIVVIILLVSFYVFNVVYLKGLGG